MTSPIDISDLIDVWEQFHRGEKVEAKQEIEIKETKLAIEAAGELSLMSEFDTYYRSAIRGYVIRRIGVIGVAASLVTVFGLFLFQSRNERPLQKSPVPIYGDSAVYADTAKNLLEPVDKPQEIE